MTIESSVGPADPRLMGSPERPVHVFLIDDEIDAVSNESSDAPARALFILDTGLKELSNSMICYHRWQCPTNDYQEQDKTPLGDIWESFCAEVNKCITEAKVVILVTDLFISISDRENFNFGLHVASGYFKTGIFVWVFTKNDAEARAGRDRYDKTVANATAIIDRIRNLMDWRNDFIADALMLEERRINPHEPLPDGVSLRSMQYAGGYDQNAWAKSLFYCEKPDIAKVVPVSAAGFYECKTRAHICSAGFSSAIERILKRKHGMISVTDEVRAIVVLPFMPAYIFLMRLCDFLQQLDLGSVTLRIRRLQPESRIVALDIPLLEAQQLMGHLLLRSEAGQTACSYLPNLLKCKPFDSSDTISGIGKHPSAPPQWNRIERKFSRTNGTWTCPVVGVTTYSDGIQLQWIGIPEGTKGKH